MAIIVEDPPAMTEAELYAELNAIANRSAFILAIDDETLHDWFLKQVGWWGNHANRLKAAFEAFDGHLSLKAWEVYFRFKNAEQTLALLREKQHVLCCREHGVQGVTVDDWLNAVTIHGDGGDTVLNAYAALADRGVFEGDWAGWERTCERCLQGQIKREAERRFRGEM